MLSKILAALAVVVFAVSAATTPQGGGGGGYPVPASETIDAPAPDTATPAALFDVGDAPQATPTHLIPTLWAMWTATDYARRFPTNTPYPPGYPAP